MVATSKAATLNDRTLRNKTASNAAENRKPAETITVHDTANDVTIHPLFACGAVSRRRRDLLRNPGSISPPAMNLDVNTLFLVTIYVEAILGLLLLFVWAQNTAIHAVAWWGFAHLLRAASVTLFGLYGAVSDLISIDLANALLFTAFGLTYTGARIFDHRGPRLIVLFGGAIVWLALSCLPGFAGSFSARVLLSSGIVTAYTWRRHTSSGGAAPSR
jgi:hypothetical protein